MRARSAHRLPASEENRLGRAIRLQWVTLGFLATIVVVMYLAMGASQVMRTAWVEDMLSMLAPTAFLISTRVRRKEPTATFPYGFHRAVSIAFLAAAVALVVIGAFLAIDSIVTLARREHPTIGLVEVFGHPVWRGWLMIAALAYSAVPPFVLGRLKLPLSRQLHDKTLYADADTNKADWSTALAGILGVGGIGVGLWWADGVAALFISVEVLKDGVSHLRNAASDLMDRHPTTVERSRPDPLIDRIRETVERLPWARRVETRFREEGDVLAGELFIESRGAGITPAQAAEAAAAAAAVHWRVWDVVSTVLAGAGADAMPQKAWSAKDERQSSGTGRPAPPHPRHDPTAPTGREADRPSRRAALLARFGLERRHLDIMSSDVYAPSMRTTLRLADDVYRAVKSLADAEDRSLGEVASELIRRGLRQEPRIRYEQRFPVFDVAEDSPPITLETVQRALDDEP